MPKQALKLTTVNLTQRARNVGGEDAIANLEIAFTELERQTKQATLAQRKAVESEARRQLMAVQFLLHASDLSEIVSMENNWMLPRRNSEGEIVMDNPMTRRDALAAVKAHHKQLASEISDSDLDMFDEGEAPE